jgi:hypothetical protein
MFVPLRGAICGNILCDDVAVGPFSSSIKLSWLYVVYAVGKKLLLAGWLVWSNAIGGISYDGWLYRFIDSSRFVCVKQQK